MIHDVLCESHTAAVLRVLPLEAFAQPGNFPAAAQYLQWHRSVGCSIVAPCSTSHERPQPPAKPALSVGALVHPVQPARDLFSVGQCKPVAELHRQGAATNDTVVVLDTTIRVVELRDRLRVHAGQQRILHAFARLLDGAPANLD